MTLLHLERDCRDACSERIAASKSALKLEVASEFDVAAVVMLTRRFCVDIGATPTLAAHVATAASELANNLWMHSSRGGHIGLRALQSTRGAGVELVAHDDGPGIVDLALALTEGYSTGGGLGCGLPGVRRLMDEFELDSAPGRGTAWRCAPSPSR